MDKYISCNSQHHIPIHSSGGNEALGPVTMTQQQEFHIHQNLKVSSKN